MFKTFNLDQNYPDLEIPFFAIQDQVIRFTFMPFFQSNIGLDRPVPDYQIRITALDQPITWHDIRRQCLSTPTMADDSLLVATTPAQEHAT